MIAVLTKRKRKNQGMHEHKQYPRRHKKTVSMGKPGRNASEEARCGDLRLPVQAGKRLNCCHRRLLVALGSGYHSKAQLAQLAIFDIL